MVFSVGMRNEGSVRLLSVAMTPPILSAVRQATRLWYRYLNMGHECRILSSSSSPWFLPTQPSQYSTYSTTKVQRVTPLYLRAEQYLDRVALIDCHAMHTYDNILNLANNLVDRIGDLLEAKNDDVRGSRIAILCNNDISYVTALWATWMVQGIAVPLYPKHLASEVEYYIHDSTCLLVITTEDHAEKIQPVIDKIGIRSLILHKRDYVCDADITREELESDGSEQRRLRRTNRLNQLHEGNKFKHQSAFVIYTSGTTGKPKVNSFLYLQFSFQLPVPFFYINL